MKNEVEVFVPVLFKFNNDGISFNDDQLKKIKEVIFSDRNGFTSKSIT